MSKLTVTEELKMYLMSNKWHTAILEEFNILLDEESDYTEYNDTGSIEEIEYKARDGFFPFTNGGMMLSFRNDLQYILYTGKGFNEKARIESITENLLNDAKDCFIENNRELLNTIYNVKDEEWLNHREVTYHDLIEKGEELLAEELSQLESDYLVECDFLIEFRAMYFAADNYRNVTGKDEICFMAGINTDFNYFRDKGLNVTFEKDCAVDELNDEKIREIFNNMKQSIFG